MSSSKNSWQSGKQNNSLWAKENLIPLAIPLLAAAIGSFIGSIPGWLAYSVAQSADFNRAKVQILMETLRGTEEVGLNGISGEMDGVYAFSHDPHVYPFSWQNLKRINRNIRVPVRTYGSQVSASLVDNLYQSIEVATSMVEGTAKLPLGDRIEDVAICFTEKGSGKKMFHIAINVSPDQAPCFKEDLQKFREVQKIAKVLHDSIKCTATALYLSLSRDIGSPYRREVNCENPPFAIVRDANSGHLVIVNN